MSRYSKDPRWITARFNSECPETGKQIKKGDRILYFPYNRKAYHEDSKSAQDWAATESAASMGLMDGDW